MYDAKVKIYLGLLWLLESLLSYVSIFLIHINQLSSSKESLSSSESLLTTFFDAGVKSLISLTVPRVYLLLFKLSLLLVIGVTLLNCNKVF